MFTICLVLGLYGTLLYIAVANGGTDGCHQYWHGSFRIDPNSSEGATGNCGPGTLKLGELFLDGALLHCGDIGATLGVGPESEKVMKFQFEVWMRTTGLY